MIPPGAGGGGGCPEGDCEVQGMGAREYGIQDGVEDRITVVGTGFPQDIYRIFLAMNGGGGGGGGGDGSTRGVPASNETPSCNTGESDFDQNEQALRQLWDDSNYTELRAARRMSSYSGEEHAAFILPGGIFQRVAVGATLGTGSNTVTVQWVNSDACNFGFGPAPANWPSGTIMVHSHPWAIGDDQIKACGPHPQQPGPTRAYVSHIGEKDRIALQELGLQRGVVLDGDGTHFYEADNEDVDSKDRCH